MAATRTLSTAEERSDALVRAAVRVFAGAGFHATPTTAVAAEAGISTAYAFKLFPTKVDLFVAAVDACYDRIVDTLRGAVGPDVRGRAALDAMGSAYAALIADRTLLMLQVHALAATSEPRIRDAVRRGVARTVEVAQDLTGAPAQEIQDFLAVGQLCHLLTAIDAFALDDEWATTVTEGIEHLPTHP
ncbi:TetR/AcrR family transcriptional regulator [Williamsia serinedens]|uniref:Transcriptional regulator, TetR family n=1 Tax=Williamsia serinedens TaxID=391736 RepID=A0ABT1H433_9NOCA|nr:TetR/AcrR family transcriptional regulator [Williamsia serinedens]MCP2160523.1 transcriptional regulator, TetR family [Williamsia serinedens]